MTKILPVQNIPLIPKKMPQKQNDNGKQEKKKDSNGLTFAEILQQELNKKS
jgi:hypothetical protein